MIVRHLYVHLPFCHRICPYCAFYKHQPGETSGAALVDALLLELDSLACRFDIRPQTLYFGGGTPTLLTKAALGDLLTGFQRRLGLEDLAEWTMEANPMTFDAPKATLMRSLGVTRVSLGVQSWKPGLLETLGRDHSPSEAERSFEILRDAGFPTINIDLMFSLPNQSLEDWRQDLERTIAFEPAHISAYNLTYEEDTPFFEQLRQGVFREDADDDASHFYLASELLTEAGYRHYEISNYAQQGQESQHNQAYWTGADYLGLGPSAVSTVDGKRWRNVPDTALYVRNWAQNRPPVIVDEEWLTDRDRHNERVALLLRTSRGLPADVLTAASRKRADELAGEGVLELVEDRYRLTPTHRALADPVAVELFV